MKDTWIFLGMAQEYSRYAMFGLYSPKAQPRSMSATGQWWLNDKAALADWCDQVRVRDLADGEEIPNTLHGVFKGCAGGWFGYTAFVSESAARTFAESETSERADFFVHTVRRGD